MKTIAIVASIALISCGCINTTSAQGFQFSEAPSIADDISRPNERDAFSFYLESNGWRCPAVYGVRAKENNRKDSVSLHVGCYERADGELKTRGYLITMQGGALASILRQHVPSRKDAVFVSSVPAPE